MDGREFWLSVETYPPFGPKLRRFYELEYLVPQLKGDSLLDIGCGDGTLLHLLMETTDIKDFFACDISPRLLAFVDDSVIKFTYDAYEPTSLPAADIALLSSVVHYITDDDILQRFMKNIQSRVVFIKAPCVEEGETIGRTKSGVGDNYVACYRRLEELLAIVGRVFDIADVSRAYPDEIESKFGSLQFWIKGVKK